MAKFYDILRSIITSQRKGPNVRHLDYYTWRFHRNAVSKAIRAAKHSYTALKPSEANTSYDPSAWYGTVKQLCGIRAKNRSLHIPGMEDMTLLEAADSINVHSTSVVSSLPALARMQLPAFLPARNRAHIVARGDMWLNSPISRSGRQLVQTTFPTMEGGHSGDGAESDPHSIHRQTPPNPSRLHPIQSV